MATSEASALSVTTLTRRTYLRLDSLTQLEELQLICSISDTSLRRIAALPNLKAVDIQFTPVTDVGIQYLANAPSLTLVVLTGTSLTDNGLSTLAKTPSLRRVFAEKTSITAAGLSRFHELRADCTIQHDNGVIAAEQGRPPERRIGSDS